MRKIVLRLALLSVCFMGMRAMAQKAENIESVTKDCRENTYYHEQAALWKAETVKNRKNARAWYNYYKACRYEIITNGKDSQGGDRFASLAPIVNEIGKAIPGSYEANYLQWLNGNHDSKLFPFLEKAYAIDSTRDESYLDMVTYYEETGDIVKRNRFLKKLYATGKISPGLLNYAYNVLVSLDKNAILVTSGDNDTYYPWILQAALEIRPDVTILNTNMLFDNDYCKLIFGRIGINSANSWGSNYDNYKQKLLTTLAKNTKNCPVYIALTADPGFSKSTEDNLYLVGLVYQYSTEKIDNIALIKKNMEHEYAMDYTRVSFSSDPEAGIVAYANANYLAPAIALIEHYNMSAEPDKAKYWKQRARMIAERCGYMEQIKEYLKD